MLTSQAVVAASNIGEKSGLLEMTSMEQQQKAAADPASINQFNNTLFDAIKSGMGNLIEDSGHNSIVTNSIEFSKHPSGLNALKLQTQDIAYMQSSILVSKLVGLVVKDIDTLIKIQ